MPLLRRQPFVKIKPPDNLQPDEEVFFCPLTEEIFRDYELFFERIILCNSLVWTCELTGRPGLTYQEALLCEARARDQLQSLPKCLEKVLLHLASLTHRSRLNHLNDDIFGYCKDRLFMGETVELIYDNEKLTGKITNITAPESVANNDSSDSDVVCLDDDPKPKQPSIEVDINEVTYIVQSSKKQHTLRRKHLSRKKGLLTRDKCKLFLKQHCDPHGDGIWKVKQRHSKKWDLPNVKFTSYFVGAPPSFTVSEVKKKPSAHVQKQSTATAHSEDDLIRKAKELRQQNKEAKKARNQLQKAQVESASKMTLEEKIALYEKVKAEKMAEKAAQREQIKKLLEEQKAQRKEDLAKERERRKEEKRIQEAFLREYNRPRDDLLCDDLQDLPKPTELNLPVASHVFGDVMMVLEYLKAFSALFDLEEDFPNGINLGDFCQALQSTEINGLYYDIIQFLLTAIIRLQDEEDQESGENHFQYNITKADTSETLTSNHKCYDFVMNSVNCAQKPFKCYGKCLDQLQLDSYTITEVLRLFLLGSCARSCNQTGVKFRYQQRGGYNFMDDVGLDLVKNNSDLVNKLDTSNIFDISAEDKLQVTTALINQLLSYVGCRDTLDENIEQLRQVKADLRSLQLAEQKREKDESAYRYKKRLEERANEMERAKLLAQGLPIPKELQPVPQPTETKILDLPEEEAERSSTRNKKKTKEAEEIPKDIDWEKVTPEQKEKWKRIHQSKEKEILKSLVDLQQSCGITPLGRDRTFRRYWIFRSVPGLFVEDSEEHIEPEYFDQLVSQKCSVGKTETRNGDEKSGLCEKPAKNVPVSPKGETSGLVNGDVNGTAEDHPEAMDVECNDEKDTCEESTVSVQKQIENFKQVPWSVYHSKVDIELLIQRLNPRGYREGPLRTALFECKRDIILGVEDCPISLLSGGKKGNSKQQLVKVQSVKSRNKNTQGHVEDGSARELMELSLREQLLDIEERIFVGTLGALKNVDNREAWRNALENGSYNATGDATLPINEVDSTDEKHDSLVVADLSRALCQIYDAVEPKYLNVPLGENDPKKKKPLRSVKKLEPSSANNSECSTELASTMACRWLASLRECHSLSQIFLHLSALEGCIAWSKSALNARCRICRRKGDPDKMLLCDDCDRGHHMYCLKPPVKSIPRGDWFCPECKPKQKVVFTPRKARRKSMPDDVDMEEESDEEEDADSADDEDESSEAESDDENDSNDTGDDMEDGDEEDTEGHSSADDSQEDLDTDHEPSPKETKIKIFGKKRARKLDYSSSGRSTPTSVGRKSAQSSRASTPTITESRASRGSRPAAKTTNSAAGVGENKNSRSSGRAAAKRTYAEVVQGDVNGNPSKRLSSSRSAADSLSDHMNACKQLVKKLADHKDSNFFMFPVSSRDVPDYHEIVKRPMDLGTVRVKMNNYTYSSARELIEDIKLVFSNCELYNQPSSPVYQSGQRLCEYFVKTLKELKLHTLMSGKSSTPSSIPNGDGRSRRSGSRRSY